MFSASRDSLGKRMMPRPEQKSVKWMMNVASMSCKEEALLLDTFADTLPTARYVRRWHGTVTL